MFEVKALPYLWKEAVNHGIWMGNRTMTHALKEAMTPHKRAMGEKPNLVGVPIWGSDIWVKVKQEGKLAVKARKVMFVRMDDELVGYRIYWPMKQRITVERNIALSKDNFGEKEMTHLEGETEVHKLSLPTNKEIPAPKPPADPFDSPLTDIESLVDANENSPNQQKDPNENKPNDQPAPPPAPQPPQVNLIPAEQILEKQPRPVPGAMNKTALQKAAWGNMASGINFEDLLESGGDPKVDEWFTAAMEWALSAVEEPTLEEALNSDDKDKWYVSYDLELTSLENFNTFELVNPPKDAKVIGSKAVLHCKPGPNGEIKSYKSRVTAKGYNMIAGIQYHDTFAPTIRPASLRIILVIGAAKAAVIDQCNVKNAYLNGHLDETEIIYMDLPPAYEKF